MTVEDRADRPAAGRDEARLQPLLRAAGGPLLIVASVLVVLRGFWLFGRLSLQQVDVMAFWMPRWCFLGTSLASGHLPTWLPNQFGGVPFASDPQSGWLNAPVMALFSSFSCTSAMTLLITLQPILAGLGLYWFFRTEGAGRAAATVGGLTLALTIAGSSIVLSIPFAGTLAWTALTLAGAAGFLHHRTATGAVGWLAFTGFAWSQIAAAHMSDGLLTGTIVVGLYVAARLFEQVRAKERSSRAAFVMVIILALALPALSLAALIPRLELLPRTSIGQGYVELGHLTNQYARFYARPPLALGGVSPWWLLSFARGASGYVGTLAILLAPVAFAVKRWRLPAVAFALGGLAGLVLNLDVLIRARPIRRFALRGGIGELWLRDPYRFRYLLVIAFAALAGYGLQGWLDRPRPKGRKALSRRALWLAPPLIVFGLIPLAAGVAPSLLLMLAVGSVWAVPLLLLAATGRAGWVAPLLAVLLAVELAIAGIAGQLSAVPERFERPIRYGPDATFEHSFSKMYAPVIDPDEFLSTGPIGDTLRRESAEYWRYFTYNPIISRRSSRGYLSHQDRSTWGAYVNGRSILFGLYEIQGYSPVQVFRYWKLVRAANFAPIFYNNSIFQEVQPSVLRLFGVRWIITPEQDPPPLPDAIEVARERGHVLYRLPDAQPRASIVYDVEVLTEDEALEAVLVPSFDPEQTAIVEPETLTTPLRELIDGEEGSGTATYAEQSPNDVTVRVTTNRPGLLLVRNVYDENWTAQIDGRQAQVMQVDYLMQGVPVPTGTHAVEFIYRDPAIGLGLLGSGVAWLLLLGAGVVSFARQARRKTARGEPT